MTLKYIILAGADISTQTASNVVGGAVYINGAGTLNALSCVFTSNKASTGGAIYAKAGASINLNLTSVNSNMATGSGGAIYIENGVSVKLIQGTINSNVADAGGAIYIENSDIILADAQVRNNQGSNGGAIYAQSGATVRLQHSNMTDNIATADGGVIYIKDASSSLYISNSVFTSNESPSGKGGFCYSSHALSLIHI